jgi:hypothetical protein
LVRAGRREELVNIGWESGLLMALVATRMKIKCEKHVADVGEGAARDSSKKYIEYQAKQSMAFD